MVTDRDLKWVLYKSDLLQKKFSVKLRYVSNTENFKIMGLYDRVLRAVREYIWTLKNVPLELPWDQPDQERVIPTIEPIDEKGYVEIQEDLFYWIVSRNLSEDFEIGDYGEFKNNKFQKQGNIKDKDINFEINRGPLINFEYFSKKEMSFLSQASADNILNMKVEFGNSNSTFLKTNGLTIETIEINKSFKEQILKKFSKEVGNKFWAIVTSVAKTKFCALLIADERNCSASFQLSTPSNSQAITNLIKDNIDYISGDFKGQVLRYKTKKVSTSLFQLSKIIQIPLDYSKDNNSAEFYLSQIKYKSKYKSHSQFKNPSITKGILKKIHESITGDYFLSRPLEQQYKLGDYGFIDYCNYGFQKLGNIKDLGIEFICDLNSAKPEIEYSSKGVESITLENGKKKRINFSKANTIYLKMIGIETSNIANIKDIGNEIIKKFLDGSWKYNMAVVTSLRQADSTTLVVSKSKNASIVLESITNLSVDEILNSNQVSFQINVGIQKNIGIGYYGEKGLQTFYQLSKVTCKVPIKGKELSSAIYESFSSQTIGKISNSNDYFTRIIDKRRKNTIVNKDESESGKISFKSLKELGGFEFCSVSPSIIKIDSKYRGKEERGSSTNASKMKSTDSQKVGDIT